MLYKLLCQRNPEHDLDLICRLRLLYEGGYSVTKEAKKLLPKAPNESQEFYEYRCKQSSYMPYFGQLVDYLVGCLFQQDVQVTPAGDAADPNTPGELPDELFYPLFAANADRKQNTFSCVLREAVTEALVVHCSWLAVDMPPAVEAETRKDEEDLGGSRAYTYIIPVEQVYDWCEDDEGNLKWAVLGRMVQERPSPTADRDTCFYRFKVWTLNPDGTAHWELYETEPLKPGQEPKPEDDIPLKDEGDTSFQKIPIDRLELPAGLWAGNKVGPLAEEHYRRRSDMIGSMARSLVEIPVIELNPSVPDVGGAIGLAVEDPHHADDPVGQFRKKGYTSIDGKLHFAGPSGTAYEITDKQLRDLRDEIHRSVHAMALSIDNSAAAVGRSGESKAEDKSATEVVLDYLGTKARELAVRIYQTISEARGEDVKWVAHGLDAYDLDDRDQLITEATAVELLDIPSKTFQAEYKTHLALELVAGCSGETKAQIQKEIMGGIDESMQLDAAKRAAESALVKSTGDPNAKPPKAPPAPGGGKPAGTSPPGVAPAPGPTPPKAPAPANGKVPGASLEVPIHQSTATNAGVAETVYNQLLEDFPADALDWVRAAIWEGPIDVPLDSIDTSNSDTWAAADEPDRVSFFDGQIEDGSIKPIILVNEPNNNKLIVVDGHHRVMSAIEQKAETIPAFVAHVATVSGPWDELHSLQKSGDSGAA